MVRRDFIIAWLGLAIALVGCQSAEPTPSLVDPTQFVTYIHPTGVFTLDVPPDWVVNDASTDYAINVEFSPPDEALPLVGLYIVSLDGVMGPVATPVAPGAPTPIPLPFDLGALATAYERSVYAAGGVSLQETGRELMPDGSLRLKFYLSAGGKISQHNDFAQVIGPYFVALRTRLPIDSGQFRTVSKIVNTMTINPLSDWSSVTESETPLPKDAVGFASLNAWVGRDGGFQIAGQVINQSGTALEFIRVQAQLYDPDGRLLAEREDFVSSDMALPNDYAPFLIVFADGMPPGAVRYELHASARYADNAAQAFYSAPNFEVATISEVDGDGLLILRGQATNRGERTASLVKVIVTLFDDQQRVIATDTALVEPAQLEPGQSGEYLVTFAELGGSPNGFIVSAQGVIAP